MKRFLIILFSAVLLNACNLGGASKPEEKSQDKKENEIAIKVGDIVVAKWSQNSFYEGKVESINDSKIKVKWTDGSSPSDVDKTDVFTLPKAGAKPDVKTGDIVLGKIASGSYWNGVQITNINGEVYEVKADSGQTSNISAEKIIKIPADIAANFQDKSKSNDFLKEAQAKKPMATAGFKPKVGETVLAEWSANSWWQAKVQKVSSDKATVAWEDGSTPSELVLDKVLPMPNAKSEMPKENQFVLAKPESGSKWIYAQTVSAKNGNIEIKTGEGKTRNIKAGDFILLN